MTNPRALVVAVSIALFLTGCFDGSNGSRESETEVSSFSTFVKDLFGATSDTTEPVQINDREFTFDDQDNETAFDDLIQQQ